MKLHESTETSQNAYSRTEADVAILRQVGSDIGGALVAINMVEHALTLALQHYFELQEAGLVLLPMLDFRAKMTVLQRDELLCNVFDKKSRSRLHKLYDKRNCIAHGHIKLASGGEVLESGEPYEVVYERNDEVLLPADIAGIRSEAIALLGVVSAGLSDITDIIRPLRKLVTGAGASAEEIIEGMRRLADKG